MTVQNRTEIVVAVLPMAAVAGPALERLAASLDEVERERAKRFRFDKHRDEFMAAHGLKRRMLSDADPSVAPQAWRFQTMPTGKPEVVQRPDLHFNLTHCDGLVACAVTWDLPLGLDAESLDREVPRELIQRHFAPMEVAALSACPPEELAKGFFSRWTLKEAFVKATGQGLSQSLQAVSFDLGDPPQVRFDEAVGESAGHWHFRRWCLAGHVVALGWQGSARPVRCQWIEADGAL
jgi:4'-phosphopantetheinyl transferase